MRQYLALMERVLSLGEPRPDRTGTGTRSIFGHQSRYDLSEGFPIVTTKRVFWRGVVAELLWMLSGSTNVRRLQAQRVHIWDEWADAHGSLGPIYGAQWRWWQRYDEKHRLHTTDQIAELIEGIKSNPFGRRHIVSAWNVGEIEYMALPPCHAFMQFYVSVSGKLSCHMYQRSADIFLGVPFNIAQYALLTHMVAHVCDLGVGELVISYGDAHIYENHLLQCCEQLGRTTLDLPTLEIVRPVKDIDNFTADDFVLHGYDPHPPIKGDVAV